jgi:hypothetical protein
VRSATESGDKLTRFGPFSSQCRAGNVKIRRGSWNEELFRVLEGFRDLAHDDEVDACSGAPEMLNPHMNSWGIYELYRRQAEAAAERSKPGGPGVRRSDEPLRDAAVGDQMPGGPGVRCSDQPLRDGGMAKQPAPWYALSGRKAQHLDAQIGALGDQFAASDRIITAIAPLHRSRSFLCPMTHFADPKGLGHDFGPSRRPEQQDIAGKQQARIHDCSGASDDRNRGDPRFESSLYHQRVGRTSSPVG